MFIPGGRGWLTTRITNLLRRPLQALFHSLLQLVGLTLDGIRDIVAVDVHEAGCTERAPFLGRALEMIANVAVWRVLTPGLKRRLDLDFDTIINVTDIDKGVGQQFVQLFQMIQRLFHVVVEVLVVRIPLGAEDREILRHLSVAAEIGVEQMPGFETALRVCLTSGGDRRRFVRIGIGTHFDERIRSEDRGRAGTARRRTTVRFVRRALMMAWKRRQSHLRFAFLPFRPRLSTICLALAATSISRHE